MTYKNKLVFLLALIAALSFLYAGSIIFSPERSNTRSMSHVWLDQRLADRISVITIENYGEKLELLKKNDQWFVLHNGVEYPARQLRIEDFIGVFTTRAAWPVRSSSASSYSRFGLDNTGRRVTIYSENTVLLDILVGNTDSTGREIYLRKISENEVRSGENKIAAYLRGSANTWFNLRLFPESEDGKADVDSVQRLSVYNEGETQIFARLNRGWTISGIDVENSDQGSIENYIRIVLNTEGDNFLNPAYSGDLLFNHSRIVIEFGNGKVTTVRFGEPDETGRRYAQVGGVNFVYSIPSWVSGRLFRDAANFERQ